MSEPKFSNLTTAEPPCACMIEHVLTQPSDAPELVSRQLWVRGAPKGLARMSEPKNPPDWRSPIPADVPVPEFTEGRELNFNTLQYRVFRRARIYLDAECFENGRTEFVNVRFVIDTAALYGLSDQEIDELMREKLRSAVQEARECYVNWNTKKARE